MQISIVPISGIKSDNYFRVDPEFYLPSHLRLEKLLTKIGSKKLESLADLFDGPFGSVLHADKYVKSGVPVLHMQNVTETGFLALDEPEFISVEDADALPKHMAYPGDVVVTKIGFLGYATVLPDDYDRYFFRREITRVKVKDIATLNPYFLATFFNSRFGRQQVHRFSSGATRDRILLVNQKRLLIPIFSRTFQDAIEYFCKSAYRQIGNSKKFYSLAEQLLLSELGLASWQPRHILTYTGSYHDAIHSRRLDAEHYQPKYADLRERIRNYPHGYCKITDIAYNSQEMVSPRETPDQSFQYVELSDINKSVGVIEEAKRILGKEAPSRARMVLRTGDVIASSVQGSLDKVALVPDDLDGSVGSTGFFVFRPRTVECGYLLALVKNIVVREQMACEAAGTILAAVPAKNLKNIIVPKMLSSKRQEIDELVRQSHAARRQAKALLAKAKRAVEMAIEEGEEKAMVFLQSNGG